MLIASQSKNIYNGSMLLDVVILPPKGVRRKIGSKLEKEIKKLPHIFIVDNKELIPHVSLWHLRISETKIHILARELRKITKGQKPIKITSTDLHIVGKYKVCLSLAIKKSTALEKLQQKVFQISYPLRTGMMPQFAPVFGHWTGRKLEEAKKFGKPLGFTPHITAGWMENEKGAQQIVKNMKGVRFDFWAKEIYICEIDRWWQVRRIIKKIEFS